MRHSTIRQLPSPGISGPDIMYVVDIYKDGKKVGTSEFPGKSIHYAEKYARNWDEGVIDDKRTD